jgi:hypothetical protein
MIGVSGQSMTTSHRGHVANRQQQPKFGVDGLDVAHLGTLNDSILSAQVSSQRLVDDWFHACNRRSGPLPVLTYRSAGQQS